MRPFYVVSLSRWEGISIPHQLGSLGNSKTRATTYDLQGLFVLRRSAESFVRRLIEVDVVPSREHYLGNVSIRRIVTEAAIYYIVDQGTRPIGIYRVIRLGFGPWAFQHQGDGELHVELQRMGWLV